MTPERPIYPSAARTATSAALLPDNSDLFRGIMIVVNATVVAGGETFAPQLEAHIPGMPWGDDASNVDANFVPITQFTAIGATGKFVLVVYPGSIETGALTASTMEVQAIPIPYRGRINVTHSSTGAHTYTIGIIGLP